MTRELDSKLAKKIIKKIEKKDYICVERNKFDFEKEKSSNKILIQKPDKHTKMKNSVEEKVFLIGEMIDAIFDMERDFFVYDREFDRIIKYGQEETKIEDIDFLKMPSPKILKDVYKPKSIFDLKTKVKDPDEAITIKFLVKWVLKQDISTEVFYELSAADTLIKLSIAIEKCLMKGQRQFSNDAEIGLEVIYALLNKKLKRAVRQ